MTSKSDAIPAILDADIDEVERYLGVCFDSVRREILKSNSSFDVQAAPGSGKTTLLVAKLAILAKKWPYARRGICVLSHTNVAREEVGRKLSGTAVGQRLLEYPHFIGTIHGFVNEFLALPFLRSRQAMIRLIDDDVSGDFCLHLFQENRAFQTARRYLSHRKDARSLIRGLRLEGDSHALGSAGGRLLCRPNSESYKQLDRIKRRAIKEGYWRHDDMLAVASTFLTRHPTALDAVRWRFPVVFVDEAQDTSEIQSSVISRVFPIDECGLRQRFGDTNQAIYDFGEKLAATDSFPGEEKRSIPNSKRFGLTIAQKAEPLAIQKPDPELIGDGPQAGILGEGIDPANMPHTVFCFEQDRAQDILPAFGKLVLASFPDEMLLSSAFVARAIGRVGKITDGPEKTRPRNLCDYWPEYEPLIARREPRPRKLSDFFHLALRKRSLTDDCAESVQVLARGLIELIDRITPVDINNKARSLSWLREKVPSDRLDDLFWEYCVCRSPILEQNWSTIVALVKTVLAPIIDSSWSTQADDFVQWSSDLLGSQAATSTSTVMLPNRFKYCEDGREAEIEIGTIHSAKGQTHTATLLLETYHTTRDLADLLPWLIAGRKKPQLGPERQDRMRLIFTAMTRPSHLLCLALRADALGQGNDRLTGIAALQAAGWQVVMLDSMENEQTSRLVNDSAVQGRVLL